MLGNLEDSVHCSGPSDPEGSGQGCGEKLPLWMRLPLAWSVPARGGTPGERYTTAQCHTAQVQHYTVDSSPCALLLIFERICCAEDLNWGAEDSV